MFDADNPKIKFSRRIPPGDDRERFVCDECSFIHYENPKVIVGSVATWDDRILLVKRAIPPREGYWALPAGFLENRETTQQGAAREAWEEARAKLEIGALLAIYNISHISQVHVIYRATLVEPEIEAGIESQAVELFAWDDLPWNDLAFPNVQWALRHHEEVKGKQEFAPFDAPEAY